MLWPNWQFSNTNLCNSMTKISIYQFCEKLAFTNTKMAILWQNCIQIYQNGITVTKMVLNKTNLANWDKFGFQLYKFGIVVTKLAFTNAKMQYFDKMVFKNIYLSILWKNWHSPTPKWQYYDNFVFNYNKIALLWQKWYWIILIWQCCDKIEIQLYQFGDAVTKLTFIYTKMAILWQNWQLLTQKRNYCVLKSATINNVSEYCKNNHQKFAAFNRTRIALLKNSVKDIFYFYAFSLFSALEKGLKGQNWFFVDVNGRRERELDNARERGWEREKIGQSGIQLFS